MKFRDRQVDGFFTIHSYENTVLLSNEIETRLDAYNADMEDVQYSTHIDPVSGRIVNDVLVMYRERRVMQNEN